MVALPGMLVGAWLLACCATGVLVDVGTIGHVFCVGQVGVTCWGGGGRWGVGPHVRGGDGGGGETGRGAGGGAGGWTGIFGTPSPYPRLRGGDVGIEGEGTRWIPAFAGMRWGRGIRGGAAAMVLASPRCFRHRRRRGGVLRSWLCECHVWGIVFARQVDTTFTIRKVVLNRGGLA